MSVFWPFTVNQLVGGVGRKLYKRRVDKLEEVEENEESQEEMTKNAVKCSELLERGWEELTHAAIRLPPKILCFGQFLNLQRNQTPPEGAQPSRGVELNAPGGLISLWRALHPSGGPRIPLEA